jgi:signal transduction histidine kinase
MNPSEQNYVYILPAQSVKAILGISLALMALAGWGFYGKHFLSGSIVLIENTPPPPTGEDNLQVFSTTFYCLLLAAAIFSFFGVFIKHPMLSILCQIIGVLSCVIAGYTVPSAFSIIFCMVSALIINAGIGSRHPYNIISVLTSFVLFFLLSNKIFVIERSVITPEKVPMAWTEYSVLLIITGGIGTFIVCGRIFLAHRDYEQKINRHSQEAMLQLSEFNRRLQAHAYEVSEKAAARERNRITREMHDANGYAFTNIIALMDAAISSRGQSWTKVEEHLQLARSQAYNGLMESRQTLRALRNNIKPPVQDLPKEIYDIVHICRECTGIAIEISYGNILNNYGSFINRIIGRIIQEALTNAVRHGHASFVSIQLWADRELLRLYVVDNGQGTKQIVRGIGLLGMEERIAPYGGTVETSVSVNGGFKLSVTIPLNIREREEAEPLVSGLYPPGDGR